VAREQWAAPLLAAVAEHQALLHQYQLLILLHWDHFLQQPQGLLAMRVKLAVLVAVLLEVAGQVLFSQQQAQLHLEGLAAGDMDQQVLRAELAGNKLSLRLRQIYLTALLLVAVLLEEGRDKMDQMVIN
jgi:hypothetical protein